MFGSLMPSSWERWLDFGPKPEQVEHREQLVDEGFLGSANLNSASFWSSTWGQTSPSTTWNHSEPSTAVNDSVPIDEVSFSQGSVRASKVNRETLEDPKNSASFAESPEDSSIELRIEPSLSFVRVYSEDNGGCEEDVEVEYESLSSKKISHKSEFTEEAAEYMKQQLIEYLQTQKTESTKEKKSKKERRRDLKRHLKTSLKAYMHAKEAADDASQNKELEKTVGDMIKKAVEQEQQEKKERKAKAKAKRKEEKKKKLSRSSIPTIPKYGEKSSAKEKQKGEEIAAPEAVLAPSEEFPDDEEPTELPTMALPQSSVPRGASVPDDASKASSIGGVTRFSSAIENMIQSEYQRLEELEAMLDKESALRKKLAEQNKAKAEEERAAAEAKMKRYFQNEVPECRSDESHDEQVVSERQGAAPLASPSTLSNNEISDEQKTLEAEIAAEVAKLQALQDDFVAKVNMAKFEGSSVLKSDIFEKNAYGPKPLRSQSRLDKEMQLQGELDRLRQEQSALFSNSRNLTSRNSNEDFPY